MIRESILWGKNNHCCLWKRKEINLPIYAFWFFCLEPKRPPTNLSKTSGESLVFWQSAPGVSQVLLDHSCAHVFTQHLQLLSYYKKQRWVVGAETIQSTVQEAGIIYHLDPLHENFLDHRCTRISNKLFFFSALSFWPCCAACGI